MKRKSLSKKVRFEVFKRDEFTCQYCGRHPPSVVLECDHITPVAEGGDNDPDNLVTACFDRNRGKGARSLTAVPQSLAEKAAAIAEAEAQLAGYSAIRAAKRDRLEREVWDVIDALLGERRCTHAQFGSVKMFVERLGFHDTLDAAEIARAAVSWRGERRFKYFCGVCWNKIREAEA